jgi:hypothetical protein
LTKHAQETIAVRANALVWIEAGELTRSCSSRSAHPERQRSDKAIAEYGGRVLRRGHCSAFRSRSPEIIRTSYDPEADARFVWFGSEGIKSAGTEEVSPGIMLDFDSEGR